MRRRAFLEIDRVGKSYASGARPRAVLSDASLDVAEGEFVAIVGGSGVGKTTLVSIVAGLVEPDRGEVRVAGRAIRGPGPDRGVVFQSYSLLPWMTAFENVRLAVDAVAPASSSAAERRERTEHFLRLVKLGDALAKRPGELSGGMRQRVAVARALAMEPKILLLDEPFSALDALTRATLRQEAARLWSGAGTTVLMITNDIDEAILLGDRICTLAPPAPAAPATIGLEIPVEIPRPRVARSISLEPGYQNARRRLFEFLAERRERRPANVVRLPRAVPAPAGPAIRRASGGGR